MTDIPLEFAKRCLGWHQATHHKGRWGNKARIKPTEDEFAGHSFIYTDIRKVLKYVQQWCDKHHKSLEIEYLDGEWFVSCGIKEGVANTNLGLALMSACIRAA